jgi:chromosome partitioning protein
MNIIIGNLKGGTGKSTLTLLLANYLSQVSSCLVTVIDMDERQPVARKFDKAKVLENKEPFQVISASSESYILLGGILERSTKDITLFDLPGKLEDDGLIPIFMAAQLVICPFAYDEFSFDSTVLFSLVLRKINPEAHIVFIPNRVNACDNPEIMIQVGAQLSKFGSITTALPDQADFQQANTFEIPTSLFSVIGPVFDQIYCEHIHGK